jgi:hypothetical protein
MSDMRRSDYVRDSKGSIRKTFAYLNPQGHLCSVVDATDADGAWLIATGWEDETRIAQRRAQGWRVVPCMVEWQP